MFSSKTSNPRAGLLLQPSSCQIGLRYCSETLPDCVGVTIKVNLVCIYCNWKHYFPDSLVLKFLSSSSRHSVGDTKQPFCLQSCVKPLQYAIAVHEAGTQTVHRYVGKEPSGLKFNMLSLDEEGVKGLTSATKAGTKDDYEAQVNFSADSSRVSSSCYVF